jgi:prepilin peptidase CpaA
MINGPYFCRAYFPKKGVIILANILLILLTLTCLITDIKYRKIYNSVLLPALIIGIVLNIYGIGINGLYFAIKGFSLGLAILLIPFIMGGIGAGDVKLLAVIGAIKGPEFVFYAALYMAVAGGLLATIHLTYKGRLLSSVKKILQGFWIMILTKFKVISFDLDFEEDNMFPYGIAITIGSITAFLIMG